MLSHRAMPDRDYSCSNFHYPEVSEDSYGNRESFSQFLAKFPSDLSIPKDVLEEWIYRHNEDFKSTWEGYYPHTWLYDLKHFNNAQILSIGHAVSMDDLLDRSENYYRNHKNVTDWAGRYILQYGTFPSPIIVAKNCGHIAYPYSGGKMMHEPFQLIEGHRRLSCLISMIKSGNNITQKQHAVWVATIPS